MCGIFGYVGYRKNAPKIVLSALKTLEYRGYDSWGIAYLDSDNNDKLSVTKKIGKIPANSLIFPQSVFSFGHTRWATHGGVTVQNAHPHLDCHGQFAVIHNGIIENYDVLKKDLLAKKHHFISETDTEVAVHLIEENYNQIQNDNSSMNIDDIFLQATIKAFKSFTGLNAIIVANSDNETFIAAKNGSPLVLGKGINENFLSSDAHALLPYTRDVYFLEDEQAVLINAQQIKVLSLQDNRQIKPKFVHLNWETHQVSLGNYPHFMLKEIYDQPLVLRNIIRKSNQHIESFAHLIDSSYGTYLVGCGSAAYACLAGTYIFSKVAQKHVNFSVGSEFGFLVDFLTPQSLVLALSQSGETIDVIDAVKKAREKKAKIASLVNVLGSSLYRISDEKMLLDAGIEKAVVSTKAFTAKLAYLILFAYALRNSLSLGKKYLLTATKETYKLLHDKRIEVIKKIVSLIKNSDHIYIIGRGLSYPISLETALKIKEASYIHAEGFAAGELKHGVIALIEKNTPCIVFVPNDETYGATLAGAMEMKARGGLIIGISFKNHQMFDYFIPVADCQIATIIPAVVVGQLLGYYLAVAKGLDPDKPRNLAKSVTVK